MDLRDVMATNLRKLRAERGLTQEELAHRVDISMRYLGSIERAKVSASVTILGRIAQALEVNPCDLIRESG